MNIKELARTIEVDEETYIQLLELFYERSCADLKKIECALRDGLGQDLANAAHSIKGAASSLRIEDIYEQAREIELKGRQNSLEGLERNALALKERLEFVRTAGEEWKQQ